LAEKREETTTRGIKQTNRAKVNTLWLICALTYAFFISYISWSKLSCSLWRE